MRFVEEDAEGYGMRYWVFVTITDNMTQQVTGVSPQQGA